MILYFVFTGQHNEEVVALQSLAEKPSKGEDDHDDLHGRSNIAPRIDVNEAMQGAYAMYFKSVHR